MDPKVLNKKRKEQVGSCFEDVIVTFVKSAGNISCMCRKHVSYISRKNWSAVKHNSLMWNSGISRGRIWVFEHPPQHPAYLLMQLTITEALIQAVPGCVAAAGEVRLRIAKYAHSRSLAKSRDVFTLCVPGG